MKRCGHKRSERRNVSEWKGEKARATEDPRRTREKVKKLAEPPALYEFSFALLLPLCSLLLSPHSHFMDSSKGLTSFARLAIVLDLSPASWALLNSPAHTNTSSPQSEHTMTLHHLLDHLLVFSHQYHILNRSNRISLLTLSPKWYATKIDSPAEHTIFVPVTF